MDKNATRGVVQFFHMEGKTAQEIYDLMLTVLGESCPTYEVIVLWLNEIQSAKFNISRESK